MSDVDRFAIYQEYVRTSGRNRNDRTKRLPGHWRPMRYCEDDWILSVWVDRVAQSRYEVALFLAEDHEDFVRDTGVMGGIVFMLSEAYQKTGRMSVHFVGPPRAHEPGVPTSIQRVAASLGITLVHRARIDDNEGRELYARITGLSERSLKAARGIDSARASFVVQRRIWSREQVEFLCEHATAPDRLFDGGAPAENRISYQHDLLLMRNALLAERVQTILSLAAGSPAAISSRWSGPATVEFKSTVPLRLEPPVLTSAETASFPAGEPIAVHLRPRKEAEYGRSILGDVENAGRTSSRPILALTLDARGVIDRLKLQLRAPNQPLFLIVVETVADLDVEIQQRLARMTSTRRPLPEQPDN